jgi:hypothetical protein
MYTFLRHAVKTAQVAAIGYCQTQVIDRPVMVVEQSQCAGLFTMKVTSRSQNTNKKQTPGAKNAGYHRNVLIFSSGV